MNKFIKHKVRLINDQLKQTFLPHTGRVFEVAITLSNGRANQILKVLRTFSNAFLLKNNPDLEALIWQISQATLKDATLKNNINQQYGALGSVSSIDDLQLEPKTAEAAHELTATIAAQLEKRKAAKRELTEQTSEMRKAVIDRVLKVTEDDPKAAADLKKLMGLLWHCQPGFK
jgi:hypothetical protein